MPTRTREARRPAPRRSRASTRRSAYRPTVSCYTTGSIGGAVALSGIIDSGPNPRFAFIANGNFTEAQGQALQAAVAHAVATYPAVVDPGALVPAPDRTTRIATPCTGRRRTAKLL